jgi:hypothetical protein
MEERTPAVMYTPRNCSFPNDATAPMKKRKYILSFEALST